MAFLQLEAAYCCTLRVKLEVCCTEPDVAVTVTVKLEVVGVGGAVDDIMFPPPQPDIPSTTNATAANPIASLSQRLRVVPANNIPKHPNPRVA